MNAAYVRLHRNLFGRLRHLDGLPPLLMRLYLAPVMIAAGLHKFRNWEDMVAWFGNPEWGLGLPAPALAAGNCIVLKPAEATPLCAIEISPPPLTRAAA